MAITDQLFAVLARLRLGLTGADVAARLDIPGSSYCQLFSTWILFLSKELKGNVSMAKPRKSYELDAKVLS